MAMGNSKSIKRKSTEVSTDNGVGKQLEQTLVVEENNLPSPQELAAYKEVDPNIVPTLLEMSVKEQQNRHAMENAKIQVVKDSELYRYKMNIRGMTYALISLVVLLGIAALALYLDKPWFAVAFGGAALVAVVSAFTNAGQMRSQ